MRSKKTSGAGSIPATKGFELSLDSDLNARDAASLHGSILAGLQQNESVQIDARKLASLDTSVVQVLLAARKTATRLKRKLTVLSERDGALPETLQRLGLSSTALD